MVSFRNTEIAFATYSDAELRHAYYVFVLMSHPLTVGIFHILIKLSTFLGLPMGWFFLPPIYKHFVGGDSLKSCDRLVSKLWSRSVSSILEYSVETNKTPELCGLAFEEILRSVYHASANPGISHAVFKPSSIINQEILELVSRKKPLSESQSREFNDFRNRLELLCSTGSKLGVAILIDAEESWTQSAVDGIAEEMMSLFNTERAWVYNTLQMYRIDRMNYLMMAHARAVESGYIMGVKLVRGAYMNKEQKRAEAMGYHNPIHTTKPKTDTDFNRAIKYCILNIDSIWVCCASHNESSTAFAALLMERNGISPQDRRVLFAHLYGMSHSLAFNLANAGFNVARHIPYGPIKDLIPYLLRRAHENRSIEGQAPTELRLIKAERERRRSLKFNT